jgi:hypothetical protein
MPVGQTYAIEPIAPVEEATTRFRAGSVTIGLELRQLDADIVGEFYEGRADEENVMAEVARRGFAVDGGLSIHVFGSEDGREYLRFDCFETTPHYHYVLPDEDHQVVNEIDVAALGDPFAWSIATLRTRLDAMLRDGGAADLADRLDQESLAKALDGVVALAKGAAG